ncbi:MAG: hypothetical protein DMF73_20390 [Acidobacteria bacterium]|nr:MAG: hypothetical protein DMF73_20390 [Acidobacteriota bacterium]
MQLEKGRRVWVGVEVVAAEEASEAFSYGLMEAGALGTETREIGEARVAITAYFNDTIDEEVVRGKLLGALSVYNLSPALLRELRIHEVVDRDWLAEWKKDWQPVAVGDHFIIAPPWSEINDARGRIVIRIEPGMAFGTGTHETTRLCLETIEKHFEGGSFLDVGTGTGILAIAAAKLFPEARIEAYDTDGDAVAIARDNAQLNNVLSSVDFRVGTIDETTASADCVCANLTADAILPLLPALLGATCGRLILSGILVEQIDLVRSSLNDLGISMSYDIVSAGEWAAIIV